jgi:hypothetical protein
MSDFVSIIPFAIIKVKHPDLKASKHFGIKLLLYGYHNRVVEVSLFFQLYQKDEYLLFVS